MVKFSKKASMLRAVVIGMLGTIVMMDTLSSTSPMLAYTNSFMAFLFGIFSIVGLYQIYCMSKENSRNSPLAVVFALLLSTALIFGKQLETYDRLLIQSGRLILSVAEILILAMYFSPLVQFGWGLLGQEGDKPQTETVARSLIYLFVRNWVLIFICWIPVFLAFYPGAFTYDAQAEYVQVATREFTTHHPLLHVLLLGGFVCAGNKFLDSYNIGIALYTVFQMLVLSGTFSYCILFLKSRIKSRWVEIGSILFFGFFPIIPMYAVCSTKDVLFTAALLIFLIQLLQLCENPENYLSKRKNWCIGIGSSSAMLLLRNNGFYAYVVWLCLLLLICGILRVKSSKRIIKKGLVFFGSSILIYFTVSMLMAFVLGATPGGKQELLTVPIQQLTRMYYYNSDGFTEEQKETLYEILPEDALNNYRPRLSDLVKISFNNEQFTANPGKYVDLWMDIGRDNLAEYVNAWLLTSYGYWYPDAINNVYEGNQAFTYIFEDSSFFGFETEQPGTRESKFPMLEEFYRKLSLEIYQHKVPIISMFFSTGFMFWVYLYVACYWLQRKQWNKVIPMLLIGIYWLTLLLGPTYVVRYVLVFWFALPLLVTEVLERKE